MIESERERARQAAAEAAALLVESDMVVGLGTGDSAARAIRVLARRRLSGLRCVPTSKRTHQLAEQLGLPLVPLDGLSHELVIDLVIDGADEIDPELRLIKGGGGALLWEKLVAHSARRLVIVADTDKQVSRLGERRHLPVEVVPYGAPQTLQRIRAAYPGAVLRMEGEAPQVTDSGNRLVDVPLGEEDAADLAAVHRRLKLLLGVVETGLFLHEADLAYIGAADGSVVTRARV
jgi:ribose 5-phosphate isomerase A